MESELVPLLGNEEEEREEEHQCQICCEDKSTKDMVFGACPNSDKHIFCRQCMNDWKLIAYKSSSKIDCPTCRTFILDSKKIKVFDLRGKSKKGENEGKNKTENDKIPSKSRKSGWEKVLLKYHIKEAEDRMANPNPPSPPLSSETIHLLSSLGVSGLPGVASGEESSSSSSSILKKDGYNPDDFTHCYFDETTDYSFDIDKERSNKDRVFLDALSNVYKKMYEGPLNHFSSITNEILKRNLLNNNEFKKWDAVVVSVSPEEAETLVPSSILAEVISATKMGTNVFEGMTHTSSIFGPSGGYDPIFIANVKKLLNNKMEEYEVDDATGLKNGEYKLYSYTETNKLFFTATYKNGVKEGPAKYYYPNGMVAIELTYCYDTIEGPVKWYYPRKASLMDGLTGTETCKGSVAIDTYMATDNGKPYIIDYFYMYDKDGGLIIKHHLNAVKRGEGAAEAATATSQYLSHLEGPFEYYFEKKLESQTKNLDDNYHYPESPEEALSSLVNHKLVIKGTAKEGKIIGNTKLYYLPLTKGDNKPSDHPLCEEPNKPTFMEKLMQVFTLSPKSAPLSDPPTQTTPSSPTIPVGNLCIECCFDDDGFLTGELRKYRKDGSLYQVCNYLNGRIVPMGYKECYSNGIERISISEGGELRKYNREGRIELNVDGKFDPQTGKYNFDSDMILYYRGTRDQGYEEMMKIPFKDGYVDGDLDIYTPSGRLFISVKCQKGMMTGPYREYLPDWMIADVREPYKGMGASNKPMLMPANCRFEKFLQGVTLRLHRDRVMQTTDSVLFQGDGKTKGYPVDSMIVMPHSSLKTTIFGLSKISGSGASIYKIYHQLEKEMCDWMSSLWKVQCLPALIPEPYTLHKEISGYNNNEYHGKYIEYFPDVSNQIKYDIDFEYGLYHGVYREYRLVGGKSQLIIEGNYSTDYKNGSYREYHLNGNIAVFDEYLNNSPNGLCQRYNDTGILVDERRYENNTLHGEHRRFRDDGSAISVISYTTGRMNGNATYYHPPSAGAGSEPLYPGQCGNIQLMSSYLHGALHGPYQSFYPNGNMMRKCAFFNGKYNGGYETYYENGQPEFSLQFELGKMITSSVTHYKANGEEVRIQHPSYYQTITHIVGGRADQANFLAAYQIQ